MKKLIFLLIFTFSSQALALYDFAAINITPEGDQISSVRFCFEYDTQKFELSPLYFADNLYIAAVTPLAEILFVEPIPEGGLTLTQWLSGNDVPVFSEYLSEPICLGPFPNSVLHDIQIYAGIGNSLDDLIQRNSIVRFFDGFTELPKPEKAWTVMVYMVGSDLEAGAHWASQDILEMLQGTASSNNTTNLVITTGGSTRNGWTTVKRSLIENGQQYVLSDLGEKNMGDPQTLSDFVIWSKANFPAQHYALILWNHGGGTQGYGKDTSPAGNGKMMTLKQLDQAYRSIRQQIENPFDLVVYDACLMASIEVAEVTARLANVMAGSAELEPGHGIDYAHLLSNIGASPPDNGLAFGSLVKTGYIQHTKNKGTFETSQITYSVFDLSLLPSFSKTLKCFASEFKDLFKQNTFSDYQTLSRDIIRAPGYPLIESGRLPSLRSTENQRIRVDLYNLLQNVKSGLTGFSQSTTDLLNILEQMIDYETNDKVRNIHPEAGRVSIDINISNTDHLSVLPEAYTLLNDGLVYYDQRRQGDAFTPGGSLTCFGGFSCQYAQWLELQADDILGIEAYFGQESGEGVDIYRIDKFFYHYRELSEDLNLPVDVHKACQYQLCVNDQHCENISLTEQDNQLVADVRLNDSPAVLSFCQAPEDQWSVCGVVAQTDGIWGRDEVLSPGDSVVPRTLHLKNDEMIEERQGQALIVDDSAPVTLKSYCDPAKAVISAAFYSLNQERQFERLCDDGDCICHEGDTDPGCTHKGFKAGVILKR
ncbi:MAG: clostripain-related cysteine peptidase [Pseudomonadota bacterium]